MTRFWGRGCSRNQRHPSVCSRRPTGKSLRINSSNCQKLLKSAIDSPPITPAAAWQCFDRLAASAADVVAGVKLLDADPISRVQWWAHALARQCRAALDELTFLVTGAASPACIAGGAPRDAGYR